MYYLEEVRERDVDLLLFFFRLFFFFLRRSPPPPSFFFICDTLNYEDGNHLDSLLSLSLSLSLSFRRRRRRRSKEWYEEKQKHETFNKSTQYRETKRL